MSTSAALFAYVMAEPFRPFCITLATGETYQLDDPEMIQVGRTTATIFTWVTKGPAKPQQSAEEISLPLVMSIEPVDSIDNQPGG